MALALEPIAEAAQQADAALEPACIGAASGMEGRAAFNRRFVMRDGSVRTHPRTGDPHIRYAEGPIDPELGLVAINTASLRMLALLLHHTCHPVHGYPERWISAGWPGAWANGMKELCGPSCVPLVLNGCCGNIHHANHLDPSYVDDFRRMGRLLTETSQPILKSIHYSQDIVLDWRTEHLRIPLRELDAREIDAARDLLARHPEPMWLDEAHTAVDWSWVYAVSFLDLYERRQRDPQYDCEIQAFRLGDVALVGLPGEPFVEGQLRIKLEVAGLSHLRGPQLQRLARLCPHAPRFPRRRVRDAHIELVLPGPRSPGPDGRPCHNHASRSLLANKEGFPTDEHR